MRFPDMAFILKQFPSQVFECFYQQRVLHLIKCSFCITEGHVVLVLHRVNGMRHICMQAVHDSQEPPRLMPAILPMCSQQYASFFLRTSVLIFTRDLGLLFSYSVSVWPRYPHHAGLTGC